MNDLSKEQAADTIEDTLNEMKNDNLESQNEKTAEDMTPRMTTETDIIIKKDPLHIMKVVSEEMGNFLDMLKEVDEKFARMADVWFDNARAIASKDKLNEKDEDELIANLCIAIGTIGVGNIWKTVQTSIKLNDVKKTLKQYGKDRLHALRNLLTNQQEMLSSAEANFSRSSNVEDILRTYSTLRDTRYFLNCTQYLVSTYEAAQDDTFQNEVAYPSLFDINTELFFNVLTDTQKASSKEAILKFRQETVVKEANEASKKILDGSNATKAQVLLVADEAVSAMAVYNVNPLPENQDTLTEIDDNTECPWYCATDSPYFRMTVADEVSIGAESELARHVRNNNFLNNFKEHFIEIGNANKRFQSCTKLYMSNVWLFGILMFFIALFNWDLAWYWSLGIGVIAFIIGGMMAPVSSLEEEFRAKVTKIERCIQIESLKKAGYVKPISLYDIHSTNSKKWYLIVIGGVIGLVGGPIGCIIGLLIGAALGGYINIDSDKELDTDYSKMTFGKKKTTIGITIILVIFILIVIAGHFIN